MTSVNLSELRSGPKDCPSELALDRLAVGSMPPNEATSLREHVEHCVSCTEHMALRRENFAGFPEFDAQKPLRVLHRHLEASEKVSPLASLIAWLRGPRLAFAATGTFAMAVLAIVLVRAPWGPSSTPDEIRIKGELALHVYRQHGQTAKQMMSGDHFRPGDNLRFTVDLSRPGYISIVGVDSLGKLYLAWPLREHQSDTRKQAGRGQELQGGVTLDDTLGDESLYLVQCPQADGPSQCRSEGKDRQPACPSGCSLFRFLLKKAP